VCFPCLRELVQLLTPYVVDGCRLETLDLHIDIASLLLKSLFLLKGQLVDRHASKVTIAFLFVSAVCYECAG